MALRVHSSSLYISNSVQSHGSTPYGSMHSWKGFQDSKLRRERILPQVRRRRLQLKCWHQWQCQSGGRGSAPARTTSIASLQESLASLLRVLFRHAALPLLICSCAGIGRVCANACDAFLVCFVTFAVTLCLVAFGIPISSSCIAR